MTDSRNLSYDDWWASKQFRAYPGTLEERVHELTREAWEAALAASGADEVEAAFQNGYALGMEASGTEPTCIGHCDVPSPKGCAICSPAPQPEPEDAPCDLDDSLCDRARRNATHDVRASGLKWCPVCRTEPEDALADGLAEELHEWIDGLTDLRVSVPRTLLVQIEAALRVVSQPTRGAVIVAIDTARS